MKIRTGFVSNSSSSSFLIALPKGTELTVENVSSHLFPKDPEGCIHYYDDRFLSKADAAGYATRDMKDRDAIVNFDEKRTPEHGLAGEDGDERPTNFEEAIGGYYYPEATPEFLKAIVKAKPDFDDFFGRYPNSINIDDRDAWQEAWRKYEEASAKWRDELKSIIKTGWADKDIYVIEYSDEDGSTQSIMEHGGVFDDLIASGNAMRISHH